MLPEDHESELCASREDIDPRDGTFEGSTAGGSGGDLDRGDIVHQGVAGRVDLGGHHEVNHLESSRFPVDLGSSHGS